MARLVEGSYTTRLPDGTAVLVPLATLSRYLPRADYLALIGTLTRAAQDVRRQEETRRAARASSG